MLKILFASAALIAGAALTTPVLAAADGPTGATRHALANACSAEVQKFCPDESRPGKIARCLRPHKDELSEECQTSLANARQARRADRANDANGVDSESNSDDQQPNGY